MTDSNSSRLSNGCARFLAEALEHAHAHGRRTAKDFVRHFPPRAIMAALEGDAALRARLLTELVGIKEKTALRTPAEDAGRMVDNALTEGDCDAEAFARSFGPGDRVRFLDPRRLWSFLVEGEFWKVSRSKDAAGHRLAQAHLAHLIDRAVAHGLVDHAGVLEGIGIDVLAEKLPRSELARALGRALSVGREGAPYTEGDLYAAVPPPVLVEHVALPHVMDRVITPLAVRAGLADAAAPPLEAAPVPRAPEAGPKRPAAAAMPGPGDLGIREGAIATSA